VLHTHGFVHEHVEPGNVFAVGDVVKLRSDCVREAPEGVEGVEAKTRDVHDLGVVLLQALTQERTLVAAARELPLPPPFDQIVRKSMSGEWGVAEIKAALQTSKRPSTPSPAIVGNPTRTEVDQPVAQSAKPISFSETVVPESKGINIALPWVRFYLGTRLIIAAGLVVMLALWLGWHFAHSGPPNHKVGRQPNSDSASTTASVTHNGPPAVATTGAPTAGINHKPFQKDSVPAIRAQWRVVAYTYNHEEQAQKKAATVAQKHPELRPEVFTPSGHAPYLVTVGGVMSRDDAFAFIQKARNFGLPSDTYAQNYSGKVR
jgi:eukaryotic-like serine/threonine-protein kinase